MEELGSPNLGCVSTDFHFRSFVASIHLIVIATVVPGSILLPAGMLISGWTAQNRVFWLVPDVVSDMNCTLCDGSKRHPSTGNCACRSRHDYRIPKYSNIRH